MLSFPLIFLLFFLSLLVQGTCANDRGYDSKTTNTHSPLLPLPSVQLYLLLCLWFCSLMDQTAARARILPCLTPGPHVETLVCRQPGGICKPMCDRIGLRRAVALLNVTLKTDIVNSPNYLLFIHHVRVMEICYFGPSGIHASYFW